MELNDQSVLAFDHESQQQESSEIPSASNPGFPPPTEVPTFTPSLKPFHSVYHNPTLAPKIEIEPIKCFKFDSPVLCVKFSGDGKYLAVSCQRVFRVLCASTFVEVHESIIDEYESDYQYTSALAFSSDATCLVIGTTTGLIQVWEILGRKIRKTLKAHDAAINSLEYSTDGKKLVSVSEDSIVKIWNTASDITPVIICPEDSENEAFGKIPIAVSPDNKLIATGLIDGTIKIWDLDTGLLLDLLCGHSQSVYSVAFSPDGKHLISASLDKNLKLWALGEYSNENKKTAVFKKTFEGHKDFVISTAFSRCGDWIVSTSKDMSVRFWNTNTLKPCAILISHANSVLSVSMHAKKDIMATGAGDCKAIIWSYKPL